MLLQELKTALWCKKNFSIASGIAIYKRTWPLLDSISLIIIKTSVNTKEHDGSPRVDEIVHKSKDASEYKVYCTLECYEKVVFEKQIFAQRNEHNKVQVEYNCYQTCRYLKHGKNIRILISKKNNTTRVAVLKFSWYNRIIGFQLFFSRWGFATSYHFYHEKLLFCCSDPPFMGEGGTIYSNELFVQSILADRYIDRR